jgi:hypothetical protein
MHHFNGATNDERYKNDMLNVQREILNELRLIRESLGRDAQTAQDEPTKRKYTRRGA